MSTALITGLGGQDGRLLASRLLDDGLDLVGLVRPGVCPPLAHQRLRVVEMDLRDRDALSLLVKQLRPDQVFHLAAHHHSSQDAGARGGLESRQKMVEVNFDATRTIAFALISEGIDAHLVLAGSSQMYRPLLLDRSVDETTTPDPVTFYGHTKLWSSNLLRDLRATFGLRASVAILFNHESPLRNPAFVTRKISLAAAGAALGRPVELELLNIAARTDWSSAADIVEALRLMAHQDRGSDYVLASGELHSVRELVTLAFARVSLDWRDFTAVREDREVPAIVGQPGLARTALGWKSSRRFDDIVAEMVDHDVEALKSGA